MIKITGIVGGSLIGDEPFSPQCWSGSSRYFFSECSNVGLLHNAVGVEAPRFKKYFYILRNFSLNKDVWKSKYHLDTGYYNTLTDCIKNSLSDEINVDGYLQIGGIYDVPSILKGTKKCFSYHDGNFAQLRKSPFFHSKISKHRQDLAYNYEKRVYDGMDGIFTMSEYLRKSFIEDFDISHDRVFCIGAGVNLSEIETNFDKKFNNKNILFVGVDFKRKGGDVLVKAFDIVKQEFPDAHLHIVGPKTIPKSCTGINGLTFHGFLSKNNHSQLQKLKQLYIDASVFVLPSFYEPFGIAPIEAMMFKTPCILTNDWAFPEMIDNGNNGLLVKCGDYNELAAKISLMLKDPARMATMGEIARNFALNNYTWEIVVAKMKMKLDEWYKR